MANGIDRGFNIELRVAPPDIDEEDADISEPSPSKIAIDQIMRSAAKIQYHKNSGEPVLFLPEGEEVATDKAEKEDTATSQDAAES